MAQQVPRENAADDVGDRDSGVESLKESARVRTGGVAERARALAASVVPSAKVRIDTARRLVAPLVLAIVPLWWICDATYRSSLMTIGRDQGIFQYVAWAVSRGDVDYRDVRDVNGPLVHMIHMAILWLGGADEHRFHVVELTGTGISFALVGWRLPGFARARRVTYLERTGWAFAAWVILSGQYQLYLYWNQAQRESFCDWFLLPSIALQLAAPARTAKWAARRITLFAALSAITWFGKPSFALFTALQAVVLLADREQALLWKARMTRFAAGAALGAAIPIAYLLKYGDIFAFFRLASVDVPRMYRFIWVKSPHEIFGADGPLMTATAGLAAAGLVTGLVVFRALPRRALVLGLAPIAAIFQVIAQAKGFGYHFHPLTATTAVAWLAIVAMLTERARTTPRTRTASAVPRSALALAGAAALAFVTANAMNGSPHLRNMWILAGGANGYRRGLPEYFETFKSYDFFPREMRHGAAYLREHTPDDARVQVYGMDPYLLFLARRKSATPYIYAYDLNADAALSGGWWAEPNETEAAWIRSARDAHEADLLARLEKAPPPAFVFIDNAPLLTYSEAWKDFQHCCAKAAAWVQREYRLAKDIGVVHVWMRADLIAAPPPDSREPRDSHEPQEGAP